MTTIGGACSPTSPPAAAPPEHGSADDAHAHHHQGKADPHTDHGGVELHHRFTDAEKWTSVFDDPARDAWQQPDAVLRAMALEPTMTVADIGAGTGYFSVRLARAVPSGAVIATDIEPDMVRYLGERAAREQLPNLRALLSTPTASGLTAQSVDRILIVDVWHHIADRVGYARDLAAALRPDGRLFIVDFSLAAQHGPPASMRLPPEAIIADLTTAGMTASVSPVALPDQYIIEASLTP